MLLRHNQGDNEIAPVMNYYEHLVYEYINDNLLDSYPLDLLQDIACVALNHLPPRYIRHQVDMSFYMSPQEHAETLARVADAVQQAQQRVNARQTG